MKKYKALFSSFHTLYRLSTSLSDVENFAVGVSRLYKNILGAEKIILVCRTFNSHGFLKISITEGKQKIKKGGISILTRREKEILKQNREIVTDTRLVYPFVFIDTMGIAYVRRSSKDDVFDEVDKRWFIALSEQVSVYLKMLSLYQEQKKIIISYIKSLAGLLDAHAPTSYIHTKSVSKLLRNLGKELKLTESEVKSLEYASMLHDTGKLRIPSRLLKKQRPLTEKEYEIIMKHPQTGAELIKDLEVLKPVAPIILHHHERYDGRGYPSHLKREDIPLTARILAVIEAFDAMFFGRPHKKRMHLEEVEKELKQQMGRQFDPRVVNSFLKTLNKKPIRKYLNSFR